MHGLLVVLATAAGPSTADVVSVAVGNAHSCALHADGAVSCWGANALGQLGDGTHEMRDVPVRAADVADAVEIGADGDRTCVRRRDRSIACWGALAPTSRVDRATALPATEAVQLAGSCWRTAAGAQCLSAQGQVVDLADAGHAIDIAGTAARGCIARANGTVACWFSRNDLRAIPNVRGAQHVALDATQACALGRDGAVTCWAWAAEPPPPPVKPRRDQLVTPRLPRQRAVVPAQVAIAGVKQLIGAGSRVCARTARDVRCWAEGERPSRIAGLGAVRAIAIGAHGCAVVGRGRDVACWGAGSDGQLGFGWTDGHAEPLAVPGLTDVVELAASFSPGTGSSQWTCARRRGGEVACWGNVSPHNTAGGDARPRVLARGAAKLSRGMVAGWIDRKGTWSNFVADGGYTYQLPPLLDAQDDCGLTDDGHVVCTFEHQPRDGKTGAGTGVAIPNLEDAAQLAIGEPHACARTSHGAVACFDARGVAAIVQGVDAIDVAAGRASICAVRRDHTVACWATGKTDVVPSGAATPVAIDGLSGVAAISLGVDHACARKADGTVWCWGANEHGELGDGTHRAHHEPVQVPGLAHVVQVVAGTTHTCALLASGQVSCWGDATTGQIGSYALQNVTTPVAVAWPRDP